MKKLQFLLIVTAFYFIPCTAQIDQQWLVQNGAGKKGWVLSGNDYVNDYDQDQAQQITQEVTLIGIRHPQRTSGGFEKNDLFVIYDDGQYFSTRSQPGATLNAQNDPFFPRSSGQSLIHQAHSMVAQHSSPIRFLYLTNIYEGDDPPDQVRAQRGLTGQNATPYLLRTTTPSLVLTASHDVTRFSDITLIIPRTAVKNGDLLSFNQTRLSSGLGGINTGLYFATSPLFNINNTPHFSNIQAVDNGNGTVTIQGITANAPPYIFINLRPTNNLPGYYDTSPELNAKAIFILSEVKNGNIEKKAGLEENILASHDPNYVKLQAICERDNAYYAFYHVEFVNTGNDAAERLSVALTIPDKFDPRCIKVSKWSAGGENVNGRVRFSGKRQNQITRPGQSQNSLRPYRKPEKAIFTFDRDVSLNPYRRNHAELSTGYIEFCIKLKEHRPEWVVGDYYNFNDPTVFFHQDHYKIFKFFDTKTRVDPNVEEPPLPATVKNCLCKCKGI